MGATSHKHHYIPQFYLRNFCRPDGTFEVYDKKYSHFKSGPQSPATVFFAKNRNTIRRNGMKTDAIEKIYAELETTYSQLFGIVNNGVDQFALLNADGISILRKYLAIQFWRLPILDEFAEHFMLSRTLDEIEQYCQVAMPPLTHNEVFERIKKDGGFRYFFRCFVLPLCTFKLDGQLPDNIRWVILDVDKANGWSNILCSDTPFIFKNPEKLFNFSGTFIFPLSNTKLLVSKNRSDINLSLDPIFSTKMAVYFFLQADRYIVATDRDYLEKIIEFSKLYEGAAGFSKLQNEVFEFIE
ncbi:hypothetical protein Meth11DRAFT_2515 [Methylophilaceae bacterium 11]|nr:hypothetical protein Meth11DRAFT_2515 [Methylophilaceae bacterium 11]